MFENSIAAPASVSTLLRELLDGKSLNKEQQMRVLEYHREILTRRMKTYSQKTLGGLACMDSGDGYYHELRKDGPIVISTNEKFGLDTRGFFAGNSFCRKKEGSRVAFGVDSDSWLLIEIHFNEEHLLPGGTYEKASSVAVTRAPLRAILEVVGVEPFHIWMYFKMITEEWVSHRKNLYDEASKFAQGMNEENCIFQMIAY